MDIPKRNNSDNISLMIKMCRCADNIQRHVTERTITSVIAGICNIIIIIIIIINCNWVVTWWQWLFYMYTKYEIGY